MVVKIKVLKEPNREGTSARSGITSPYFDLAASIAVAEIIYKKGGGTASPDQLAHWLGYKSVGSGTYLTRVSAANKHFGLIESSGNGFMVTERAKKILAPVMPSDAAEAKIEAFLSVPLFSKVYAHFHGGQLPPEVGLKNLFQTMYSVLPDRVPQAVRVFLNSAEQAGFFSTTGDRSRLIKPVISASTASGTFDSPQQNDEPSQIAEKPRGFSGGGGDGPTGGVHSAIIGLLRELPPTGSPWPGKKRFKEAFMATLDFIYPEEDAS